MFKPYTTNFFLEHNYLLKNYNRLTEQTAKKLLNNYFLCRMVPFVSLDDTKPKTDISQQINDLYQGLIVADLILQDTLLNYITTFLVIKKSDTEFFKYLLNSSVTLSPETQELVNPLIALLQKQDSMKGGQNSIQIILKTVLLLIILSNLFAPIQANGSESSPSIQYIKKPIDTFGDESTAVTLTVSQSDANAVLPSGFSKEQENKLSLQKKQYNKNSFRPIRSKLI